MELNIKQEPEEIKQEQQSCQLNHEFNAVIAEDGKPPGNLTSMQNECYNAEDTGELVLKFEDETEAITSQTIKCEALPAEIKQEQQDCQLKHEDIAIIPEVGNPIVARTSCLLRSSVTSGYTLLTVRILRHENLVSYSCNICNKKFKKLFHLQKHTVTHEDKKSTKFDTEYKRPNVQVQKNYKTKEINTSELPYSCKICSKQFKRLGDLNKHMRIHTGERPFSCKICNKSFTQSGDINTHMLTHTGKRPFSCEICSKSFTHRGNLNTHMRTHTGERPFSCEICNKSFKQGETLKTHMRIHTGERPFSCEICLKSFSRGVNLKSHMRTHTGERPYSCVICNKSFTEGGPLRRHMRTHKGERPFSCKICNKSFAEGRNLNKHMRTHTG